MSFHYSVAQTLDSILLNQKIKGIFGPERCYLFSAVSRGTVTLPFCLQWGPGVFCPDENSLVLLVLSFCLSHKGGPPEQWGYKVHVTSGLDWITLHLVCWEGGFSRLHPVWHAETYSSCLGGKWERVPKLGGYGKVSHLAALPGAHRWQPWCHPLAPSLSLAGVVLPRHVVEQGTVCRDEHSLLQIFF